MLSAHCPTGKVTTFVLVVFITAACLTSEPGTLFDKLIGLSIIVPISCLLIGLSGLVLGRVGIVLATILSLLWAIAVAIGWQ